MQNTNTVELLLSGLIGTASHPDMQKIRKIRIIYFSLKISKFGYYYLQYVPASKPFDHA